MINDLFGVIAQLFPLMSTVLVILGLVFLIRAWGKMSSGSIGAGPPRIATPDALGLQQVPWELQGIDDAIRANSPQPLQMLLHRAQAMGIAVDVPDTANQFDAVTNVLEQMERSLGLPPLQSDLPNYLNESAPS